MFDTYATALTVERALVLKRAERRAPLLEAAKRPGSAPTVAHARTATLRLGWFARAVRSVRWHLKPAHA
jgi:hypothetical protein